MLRGLVRWTARMSEGRARGCRSRLCRLLTVAVMPHAGQSCLLTKFLVFCGASMMSKIQIQFSCPPRWRSLRLEWRVFDADA